MVEASLIAECCMFELLVATNPTRPSWRGSGVGAVLLHAALVAGAVRATAAQPEHRPVRQPATRPIYVPPAPRHPTPPPAIPANPGVPSVPAPRIPFEAPTIPPPTIPPIDPAAPALDPEQLRRVTGSGSPSSGSAIEPAGGTSGRVISAAEADEPLTATYMPTPVYPPVLADAGVSGRVVVRFVVDTTGRVEPATIELVTSPHPGLTDAVREALVKARFKPGRSHGVPVRVLAEMPVTFRRVGS
jgi:protein TonB